MWHSRELSENIWLNPREEEFIRLRSFLISGNRYNKFFENDNASNWEEAYFITSPHEEDYILILLTYRNRKSRFHDRLSIKMASPDKEIVEDRMGRARKFVNDFITPEKEELAASQR